MVYMDITVATMPLESFYSYMVIIVIVYMDIIVSTMTWGSFMVYMDIIVSTAPWDSFYGAYGYNCDGVYGYNRIYNDMGFLWCIWI